MLTALYQDEEILVIDKPAGLPSQPGEGVRVSVVEAVERDFGFRPFLVHRLDKETAGCLVVARDSRSAGKWTRLIESRELRKTYRAIVSGVPKGREGRFADPVPTKSGEKPATTTWRLLASFGAEARPQDASKWPTLKVPDYSVGHADRLEASRETGGISSAPLNPASHTPPGTPRFSYLELELGTGRMHQIRIHLAAHGLPILGDDRHGDFGLNKAIRKEAGLKRLCLVSWSLELPGGVRVVASLPEHFVAFLGRFPGSEEECAPRAGGERK